MRNDSPTPEIKQEVWQIRDLISELETVKDQVVSYLGQYRELDGSTRQMWSSDMKECYHTIVAAWQMLSSGSKGEAGFFSTARSFLQAAENRLAQVGSELTELKGPEAQDLNRLTNASFTRCFDAIIGLLDKLAPPQKIEPPGLTVYKISDKEYFLPCSVCGEVAVQFRVGIGRFDKGESLIFKGITHSTSLEKNLAGRLFETLQKESLTDVHSFMKKYHHREGLDAYCPWCGKVYCARHYQVRETYDQGFYDCTYGICPQGHKRIIDD